MKILIFTSRLRGNNWSFRMTSPLMDFLNSYNSIKYYKFNFQFEISDLKYTIAFRVRVQVLRENSGFVVSGALNVHRKLLVCLSLYLSVVAIT